MMLSTAPSGLSTTEVVERQRRDGPNTLPQAPRTSPWVMLARQLTHLLALLLWIGAALALLAGMPELSVAIAVIVLLNATFAFWQEYRADASTQQLRALLPTLTHVVRNGVTVGVDVSELVVGDIVRLQSGDRVGADMSVLSAEALTLDESLVTGESGAVPREAGDRLLAGTFVMAGEATAEVRAIADRTTLAQIAAMTTNADRPPSPLTQQLGRVVRIVAVIAAAAGSLLGLAALGLGLSATESFLFGVGVMVALVPEGLLPTVTLSLARGARLMARENALVRRLDAVETLGATTFICTDKTGTITQNRMSVVDVVTRGGPVRVRGHGYEPVATLSGPTNATDQVAGITEAALSCVTGRVVHRDSWVADGDPLEAAIHCLWLRVGGDGDTSGVVRRPYTADRMLSSALRGGQVGVLGAPEAVLARCSDVPGDVMAQLESLTAAGRRVLAVAGRRWDAAPSDDMEHELHFLGLLALEDPPRPDVPEALATCRDAGIRVAMLTGDHPGTARAIAREVGLLGPSGVALDGRDLPDDDAILGARLDCPDGAVVARVAPADKLRIARVLRERGHVVAMTGDGVNDAPALREADVGVAMGASGSDVARESADLVLLDDHFATIVRAIELGRATFQNVRRFLTYHLTDNVAELTPFAVWALTGGSFPLAIGVLQVLALDIGTDMLPALALGGEPPRKGIMRGLRRRGIVDRALLVRSFLVLGATEAVMSVVAFTTVLLAGGWRWGANPDTSLLAVASGTAFAAIALGQMVNAFACRSTTTPVWRLRLWENPLVIAAVGAEIGLLLCFVGLPELRDLLGGGWPSALGWTVAALTAVAVAVADGIHKSSSPHVHHRSGTVWHLGSRGR